MTNKIGRTRNFNDTATISSAIALNSSTSVKLVDINSSRIFLTISNPSNRDIWIKLQAASIDNDKKGIFINKGGSWEMPSDEKYTGEISAIANLGTPDVYTTQY